MKDLLALMEECLVNGRKSKDSLYAWFLGEEHLLDSLINRMREHKDSPNCWCSPTLIHIDPVTGIRIWVHKDIQ